MAYEVKMYFETYTSGEVTSQVLFDKQYSDLDLAVKKFENLRRNTTSLDAWKKIRKGIKSIKLAKVSDGDFEDGYARFEAPFHDKLTYTATRELSLAFGFDYEILYVLIVDSETKEVMKR